MRKHHKKVVVAMSGGVDSSVATCLLVERGYDAVGLFMRTGISEPSSPSSEPRTSVRAVHANAGTVPTLDPPHGLPTHCDSVSTTDPCGSAGDARPTSKPHREHKGCCSASDAADARFVAGMLGVPFYALNFEDDFDELIDYFADEYVNGRTPNPCVVCNDRLKFGKLVDYADAVGATSIATGHYARVEKRNDRNVLLRGRDPKKDQSYVLFGLSRDVLDRVMFPIGDLEKSEVRRIAARYNLPNRDKPDSVDICFVPDRDYARVVRERRPEAFKEGDVVNPAGQVIGRHRGIGHYTIGQRRGLGIAAGKPVYVTELNVERNTVTLGDGEALLTRCLIADRVNFLVDPPAGPFRADVKIRYLHRAAPATVYRRADRTLRIVFDQQQRAVTPGQAVVLYRGDLVLGGAWIRHCKHDLMLKSNAP